MIIAPIELFFNCKNVSEILYEDWIVKTLLTVDFRGFRALMLGGFDAVAPMPLKPCLNESTGRADGPRYSIFFLTPSES